MLASYHSLPFWLRSAAGIIEPIAVLFCILACNYYRGASAGLRGVLNTPPGIRGRDKLANDPVRLVELMAPTLASVDPLSLVAPSPPKRETTYSGELKSV